VSGGVGEAARSEHDDHAEVALVAVPLRPRPGAGRTDVPAPHALLVAGGTAVVAVVDQQAHDRDRPPVHGADGGGVGAGPAVVTRIGQRRGAGLDATTAGVEDDDLALAGDDDLEGAVTIDVGDDRAGEDGRIGGAGRGPRGAGARRPPRGAVVLEGDHPP
jgi:hypothetical protein